MSEDLDERVNESQQKLHSEPLKFSSPEMQEARAFLRKRFLGFITGIIGERVDFNLYEDSKVSGQFRGCDVDCLDIHVRNLDTRLGRIPEAIIRSSDVISFEVECIKNTD